MLSVSNTCLFRHRQVLSALRKLSTSCSNRSATSKEDIKNVTIIGGGHMGSGIAQVCAQSGLTVTVVDNDEYAQKCIVSVMKSLDAVSKDKFPNEPKCARKFITDVIGCIGTTQSLEEGCRNADLIIEAVIEDFNIKRSMFEKVDSLAPSYTIFASNTSSLSLKAIGAVTERADRFGGLHFFNPVHKMRAVEVISTPETSMETIETLCSFVRDIGKVPVKCKENDETAGFIANSLIFPYLMEALRFFERGHASIEDIDTAMKLGANVPSGPFELIDMIGIDDMKSVVDHWHAMYPDNPKYFPSELLNNLYNENKLGRKSGQGFYTYRATQKLYAG